MAITLEEVRHIAQLARLRLTEEEERRYTEQLSAILDYAARLKEVDTSSVPPTASVLPLHAPLRPDVTRPSTPREAILANTSSSKDGMFRVEPVLEESE
jgi:aspartyl-tRNA(Asn)/glutamyl-tRNA(Gln) amidotransferase subunit C